MKTNIVVLLSLLVLPLIACQNKATPPASTASPPAAPATPTKRPAQLAAPIPGSVESAAVITDEKVKGFITYTRSISSVAREAMGLAGAAIARTKGDRAELKKELSSDVRSKKLNEAGQVALQKSGLTQAEVYALTRILGRHYAKRMMAANAAEALAKTKATPGKPNVLEELYKKQVADGEAARAEFEKTYGKAALAVVDKNEKDYLEAQQAMLKAAFGGRLPPK